MTQAYAVGWTMDGSEVLEPIKIIKPRKSHILPSPDWRIIEYADGGKVCAHVSRIRVSA